MLRSGLFLFLGLLLGRGLGLFRELLLAGNVGTGGTADIIIALITLPDILISVLLGSSLAAVFVPSIKTLSPAKRFGYFLKLSGCLGGVFTVLAVLLFWNIEWLSQLILPSNPHAPEFLHEMRWVIWAIPVLALNTVSRVFLQAENRFALLGLENVLFNLCVIAGIFLFGKEANLSVISYAILIGALLRWVLQSVQVWTLYDRNLSGTHSKIQLSDLHRYNLALITGVLVQVLPIYGRSLASSFEKDGALAIYNYAFKFIEFPMALGISVISTLIFPKLTEMALGNDKEAHLKFIKQSQSFILTLCLPATILVPILLFRVADLSLIFKQLPPEDLSRIFIAIAIGFFVFFIRGLNELYIVILNSLGDVKHPLYSTIASSTVGFVTIYLLTKFFGIYGSFWALNLSFLTALAFNVFFLQKHHQVKVLQLLETANLNTLLYSVLAGISYFIASLYLPPLAALIIWTLLVLFIYAATLGKQLLRRLRNR